MNPHVNRVILIGNITKAPKLIKNKKQLESWVFELTTIETIEKNTKVKPRAISHIIRVYGDKALKLPLTVSLGDLVYIEGKISACYWRDALSREHLSFEINANLFQNLHKPKGGSQIIADLDLDKEILPIDIK